MSEKSTGYLLTAAARFLFPYKKQILWASIALIVTAGLNLALVQYVRIIVDQGFVAASTTMLNQAIVGFLAVFAAGEAYGHGTLRWVEPNGTIGFARTCLRPEYRLSNCSMGSGM